MIVNLPSVKLSIITLIETTHILRAIMSMRINLQNECAYLCMSKMSMSLSLMSKLIRNRANFEPLFCLNELANTPLRFFLGKTE